MWKQVGIRKLKEMRISEAKKKKKKTGRRETG